MKTDKFKKKKRPASEGAPLLADVREVSVSGAAEAGPAPPGEPPEAYQPEAQPKEDGAPLAAGPAAPGSEAPDEEDEHEGIHKRACTDVLCLILFFAFLGVMGWLSHYAFSHGNIRKLIHGIDWNGEICGYGPNVSDMPYLYWCGNGSYVDITTDDENGTSVLMRIPVSLNLEVPICVSHCPRSSDDTTFCPSVTNVTKTVTGEPPEIMMTTVMVQEVQAQAAYVTKARAGKYCLPDITYASDNVSMREALQALNDEIKDWIDTSWATIIMNSASNLVSDIPNILPLLCIVCVGAFVISFIYLLLLRWLAEPLVYLILVIVMLSFLVIGAGCISTAHDITGNQHLSPIFRYVKDKQTATIVSDVIGGICLVAGLLVGLVAFCMRDTIVLVCGCIEAACECMFDMPTLLLEPVLGAALKLSMLCGLLYTFLWLVSVGEVTSADLTVGGSEVSGIHRELTFTENEGNFILVYVFGIFWIMEICDACQQFTISYAVVLWYYKPIAPDGDKKSPWFPICRGFLNGVCLHLGTLAMGSLMVALVRMLQVFLWLANKVAKSEGNRLCECIARCLMCCIECFRKSLEYINKMAYIDVAIHSNGFCKAAVKVFKFITREAPAIALLNAWTWIVQVGGVLSISSGGGYGTYMLVRNVPRWCDPNSPHFVTEPALLSIMAGGICGTVSAVFMWVFDQCVDTLLYIFADNRIYRPDMVATFAPPKLASLVEEFEERHTHGFSKEQRDG